MRTMKIAFHYPHPSSILEEYHLRAEATPGYRGSLSGPPEDCSPPEPPEIDVTEVTWRGQQIDYDKFLIEVARLRGVDTDVIDDEVWRLGCEEAQEQSEEAYADAMDRVGDDRRKDD